MDILSAGPTDAHADRGDGQEPLSAATDQAQGVRHEPLVEVTVFLFLILPSLILSLFVVRRGNLGFVITASSIILRDLGLVGLVLFFLWRNREPVARIGWRLGKGAKQVALGLVLFPVLFVAESWIEQWCLDAGLTAASTRLPSFLSYQGAVELPLAILLVSVVAISEETIFRGYLILRFKETTGSTLAAVVLSSLVFALGHGYEGTAGLATVGAMGLALALVYVRTGSLVAPIVIHFAQDFLGIVLLPLLKSHS